MSAGPRRVPWLVALPGVLFLLAFHIVPTIVGGRYAFTDWNGIDQAHGVGLGNFREIFRDPVTEHSLWNTLKFAGVFFVAVNAIGLALALALRRTLKSRSVLRALFFAPVVISPLAVGFLWRYIADAEGGFNDVLGKLGLASWEHAWTGDPKWAMWTIVVVLVWQYSGLTMVIYLAGLEGISDELIEAATVDGAGPWLRFRRVVLPLLAPAITVAATISLIFGLRLFDQILSVTGGGPANATETLATQVYTQTFVNGRFGYGAALALVLTVLIAALSIVQMVVLRLRERAM
ncbi:MAG TPA: sugar ABC transporter permease [Baekduia sp.]|uniref:carbohydrate ABC transporter permease n=1 Tax=Baekduia sp. TaxID=2600305 RepID=UPI002D775BB8|nr:sugar ABC transporter permease [Baekduia sp.]HET6508985.1 sugar ABC transporter permease [Baekduia sp.]